LEPDNMMWNLLLARLSFPSIIPSFLSSFIRFSFY
jgi:hypothetical protein